MIVVYYLHGCLVWVLDWMTFPLAECEGWCIAWPSERDALQLSTQTRDFTTMEVVGVELFSFTLRE